MTGDSSAPDGSPSPDAARQVDKVCDRFEAAWGDGPPPCIEDFLDGWPEPVRSELLYELVLLDVYYRRRRGEACGAEQYQDRFPEFDPRWLPADSAVDTAPVPPSPQPPTAPCAPAAEKRAVPADVNDLRLLGDYELLEEIGKGGMGCVRRARDPVLGRDLAVKVMREDLIDRPGLVRRFVEEAQVSSQLQHPGIPPVHELGRLPGGRPAIVMKLIQGRTLTALLKDRADPGRELPRFLTVFEQVC